MFRLGAMNETPKRFIVLPAVLVAISLAILSSCQMTRSGEYPDQTVNAVDLNRYAGKWYEIASFPAWFQRDCYCTTAEYKVEGDYVRVKNSCRIGSPDGPQDVAFAKAFPVPGTRNSQLKVQFQWPFKGDYWIIALDENYGFAMVGHPAKKYLWILSRTPTMAEATYRELVEEARSKGYDVDRLKRSHQSCRE